MWRVGLREASPADDEAVDPWLSEALAAVYGRGGGPPETVKLEQLRASLSPDQRLYLVAVAGERPAGLIICSYRDDEPVTIDALAIAAGERNLGLGAEAVYVLEGVAPGTSYLAGVPLTNGLAIYFWLRIGYCPIFPKPSPGLLDPGRIWMARRPSAQVDQNTA